MTVNTGAASARADSNLKAFGDGSGAEIVYYIGTDNNVHQMYQCAGCSHSVSQTLTSGGLTSASNTPVKGFSDGLGQEAYYVGSGFDVRWLQFKNGTWFNNDAGALASAPPASATKRVSAFPCVDQNILSNDNCK